MHTHTHTLIHVHACAAMNVPVRDSLHLWYSFDIVPSPTPPLSFSLPYHNFIHGSFTFKHHCFLHYYPLMPRGRWTIKREGICLLPPTCTCDVYTPLPSTPSLHSLSLPLSLTCTCLIF